MLNNVIKSAPLIGATLIFFGVLKLIIYYSHFDVHIIDFLEFQEIITSFFDDINIIVIFGITMMMTSFATLNYLRRKTNLHLDELMEKVLSVVYPHRFKFCIFYLLIIILLLSLIYFDFIKYNNYNTYFLIFCVVQFFSYLFLTKEQDGEINIPNFNRLFVLVAGLSFSVYLFAKQDIQDINEIEATLKLKNEVIECNKGTKNLYIGKTNKYVFVKIDSLNCTSVIPVSEIIKYQFK